MATVVLKKVSAPGLTGPLDITMGDREFVVVTGPDAREVRTVIRVLAGLTETSEGDIFFEDRRMNDVPAKDRDIAFVANDYEPYPARSIQDNLAMALKHRRFGQAESGKRIAAVAETLGLTARLPARAATLSSVERRLVGLARAMVRQPAVYLFDEPFSDLSAADASRGRAEIARLGQRASATIVYATSDPAEVLALDTRTVIIQAGLVLQDAGARAVYDAPANLAVAKWFGAPPMNLVHGTLKQEREGLVFTEAGDGTIALNLPAARFAGAAADLAGKAAVLGFRPETIRVAPSGEPSGGSQTSFRALVDRTEPRGGRADLYLRTGAHELVCQSPDAHNQAGGRRLHFEISLAQAHVFDSETGRRVTPEP